jgi:hypothetical protein
MGDAVRVVALVTSCSQREQSDCEACDNFSFVAEDPASRAVRIDRCLVCQFPLLFGEINSTKH